MFLVTGLPGKTGSATARALLHQGAQVTVLARSEIKAAPLAAAGAQVVVGSVDDVSLLTNALRGKQGAFLMIPPNPAAPDFIADRQRLVDGYAKAVRDSGIRNVVFLSSVGGELASGTGLILTGHNGEMALRGAAPNLTVLRPVSFLENWSASASIVQDGGVLPSFLTPGRRVAHIATEDIGHFAAEALLTSASGERVWYLTGPEYTPEEVAEAFSDVLQKPVRLQPVPDAQAAETLIGYGMSKSFAANYQEMTQGINSGLIRIPSGVVVKRGSITARDVLATSLATLTGATA